LNSVTYIFGGTVQDGGGVYIPRQADVQLLKLCQDSVFTYILTPRQMGKSSLMVRTAETLVEQGIRSAIADLQELGTQVTAEQWYYGFLVKLDDQLMFETDVVSWWSDRQHLGVSQRLTLFFEQVLLREISEKVVKYLRKSSFLWMKSTQPSAWILPTIFLSQCVISTWRERPNQNFIVCHLSCWVWRHREI